MLCVDVLASFNEVRGVGYDLMDGWRKAIHDFKTAFLRLGISVTPKVHIIFDHLEEFAQAQRMWSRDFS
jgi:hypothetical protein